MASKNLKKCLPLLETLSSIRDSKKRRDFLRVFESNLIRALREMCYNLLNGNIPLNTEEKKKLMRYKRILRLLADSKTKKTRFRKIVTQTGRGFLPAIIPLIVSAITSLV